MSSTGAGSSVNPWKNGGSWMYVDSSRKSKRAPSGTRIAFHVALPLKTSPYVRPNIPAVIFASASATSACVGQTSARSTGPPSAPVPIGSAARSMSVVPASAYATTSGGEAR